MRVIIFILFFFTVIRAYPQSNGLISNYMFNPLIINPAYAGFDQVLTVNAMVKHQWTDVEGAPITHILSAHSPFKKQVSLGLIVANDQIGPLNQKGIFASYAYKIPLSNGYFSFGLQAGATFYNLQEEKISLLDPLDPVFSANLYNLTIPNFGTGLLYSSQNFYLGVAIPQLLRFSTENEISYSLQRQKFIFHGSYSLPLSNDFQLNPTALFYLRKGHPAEINVGANLLIRKVIWVGFLYRNLETISFLSKIHINPQLTLGYAYDYHTGQIRSLAHGSHEFLLSYTFDFIKDKVGSPKYF